MRLVHLVFPMAVAGSIPATVVLFETPVYARSAAVSEGRRIIGANRNSIMSTAHPTVKLEELAYGGVIPDPS